MKRVLINRALAVCMLMLSFTLVAQAQQKLDNVTKALLLKRYDDAKTEIDRFMATPGAENNLQALVYKYEIYAALAGDSSLKVKYPDALSTAYDAFSQYRTKDTSLKLIQTNEGLTALSTIYSNAFSIGVAKFKDDPKEAYKYLSMSENLGDMIITHGLSNQKSGIDTLRVLYTGYAAQNAKMNDEAMRYYRKFTSQKIGGADKVDVYKFMLNNDLEKKDADHFKSDLALAKSLYPDHNDLWSQYEMEFNGKNASVDDMITKFKAEEAGGKMTSSQYAGYAEYFTLGIPHDMLSSFDSSKQANIRDMAADAYSKAFAGDNTNGIDAYNAGLLYYQTWNILDDRFRANVGETAALKAARAKVEADQQAAADKAIDYLEKAYTILKNKSNRERVETNSLSKDVDFLSNLYQWKRDRARGKNAADYDKYDAKYKQFDAEHGQYK